MIETKNGFTRLIKFLPAWDKTDPDPKRNYGISDVTVIFVLSKDKKAIEFSFASNWHLPHIFKRRMEYLKTSILEGKEQFLWESEAKAFLLEVCKYDANHIFEKDDDWFKFDITQKLSYLTEVWKDVFYFGYFWLPGLEGKTWDIFIRYGEEDLWEHLEKIYNDNFGESR
jgi:hypothetical protein